MIKITEREIQKAIVDTFRQMTCNHNPMPLIFSNHNNATDIKQATVARSQGRIAGIPDLTILLPNGKTIFIEVKTDKGRVSPVQKQMHEQLQLLGHEVLVVRSVKDFDLLLKSILC